MTGSRSAMSCGIVACFLALPSLLMAQERRYELAFSTYFGGKDWEHARDVCVDNGGNILVVGGTASKDFPTTPGAYSRTFQDGGKKIGKAGLCDAFVSKFSPEGRLIWSTLIGGPNYDRAYGVEVDAKGFIYIAGRAGPGFPVTKGAFQTEFAGSDYNGFYGAQNGFVAKLSPDGSTVLWASYVGVGELCRDIALDADGDIYLPLGWNTHSAMAAQPKWLEPAMAKAFQKKPAGGIDCGVVKISNDGKTVHWATWVGGSDKETQEASIRVDARKRPVIWLNTKSKDMPTTEGAFGREHNGDEDGYAAMLSADGSSLVYGTYVGGSSVEWALGTHNLALDAAGNAIVSLVTQSQDFPTTDGAFCRKRSGKNDIAIVKIATSGKLLASTLLGGNDTDNPDGIEVDAAGNVIFAGETGSADFPRTHGALQKTFGGKRDAVAVVLDADLKNLLYSTFLGGGSIDNGRAACLGPDGSLIITGAADGNGWPTKNAYQSGFAGGGGGWGNGDVILARLKPVMPATQPEAR